jgi:acetate kinase
VPIDISGADIIENRPFDDINLGDTASVVRIVAADDISLFAAVSGDVNPAHMDPDFARTDMFHGIIAHGMFGGALISTVLGTCLPGPGTIYLAQDLRFRRPVSVGDTITATVTVTEKVALHGNVKLDCVCTNQRGEKVITGVAEVRAPSAKIRRPRIELPEVRISRHERYHDILRRAAAIPATPTAVVHPCDEASIRAVVEAEALKLIEPVLVGPREKILAAAARAHADVEGFEIVSTLHSHAAAEQAVELVRAGRVGLLMKGSLHTDELMRAVVSRTKGLRTARRISHVYLMDVPAYPRPLIITDAAINIAPTLDDKRDIVQNAIDLAHVMGVAEPCVAILSAVETVTGRLPGTLDAAALCKMADFGRAIGIRQRNQSGRGTRQGYREPRRRTCRYPGRAGSGSGKHAGQATDVHGGGGRRGRGAGRARADHSHQPGRRSAHTNRLLRGRGADGAGSAIAGGPMSTAVLTLNAGSSSVKLALFEIGRAGGLTRLWDGAVTAMGDAPRFTARDSSGMVLIDHAWAAGEAVSYETYLACVLSFAEQHLGGDVLACAGHRVVHGGAAHAGPARVTPVLLDELTALVPLAPLHQPHNLAAIRTLATLRPALPQVACFDTAFHHLLPPVATRIALPAEFAEKGVRRYGFHGLSYTHIAERLRALAPDVAAGRVIAAHLGAGASLCAMRNGRSVDTTMGFTALDGLIMATRCGSIDAGVVLYLLQQEQLAPQAVEDILYHHSGMLGISGVSGDMQVLHKSDLPQARDAVDSFVYRIVRDAGALASVLGGLDGLVFTAGIGEHDPWVREQVCLGLGWLGVSLDGEANRRGAERISTAGSAVSVWVIEADEEGVIGRETVRVIRDA